jgi:hypothetical protein
MTEQMQKLEAFFQRKVVETNDDDGDDNSTGEYWDFIEHDEVEFWILELLLMTEWMHFSQFHMRIHPGEMRIHSRIHPHFSQSHMRRG